MITDEMIAKAAFEIDQAILDMLPDPGECDHVFSLSFQNKIKKLIRKAKHYVAYRVLKRVACILLAVLVSASMILAFNTEARAAFVDWIKEQFEGFYYYFFEGEAAEEDPRAYNLDWLPGGYTLLASNESRIEKTEIYADEAGNILRFTCLYNSDVSSLLVGLGEYEHKEIEIGRVNADIYLDTNHQNANSIVWSSPNGDILFSVTARLEESDLIKIAENLS